MKNIYPISIGCDCDQDRKNFYHGSESKDKLSWHGIEIGIPAFRKKRKIFFEEFGIWVKMTWFVRADIQIQMVYGDAGYCLKRFSQLWKELEEEGDEISWHPHLWDWDDKYRRWYQKIGDSEFTHRCLNIGYDSFVESWGKPPVTVHAGWCYQSNLSMTYLSELGLLADCSALPGHNTLGTGISDQADWSGAPDSPYFPSRNGFKRVSSKTENTLNILEIPNTMGKSIISNILKALRDQFKRGSFRINLKSFNRQVPLMGVTPLLNKSLISDAIKQSVTQKHPYFFSFTHCDEFLPQSIKRGIPRLIYSLNNFFENVKHIHREIEDLSLLPDCQIFENIARDLYTKISNDVFMEPRSVKSDL